MPLHPGAAPYELGPTDGPRVLLLHGLTGSPAELWPLALGLAETGYCVEAPRWLGHGTTPAELAKVSAEDLIAQVREVTKSPPRAIVGLSMGALLATIVARELQPAALVLLASAIQLKGPNAVAQWLGRLEWLAAAPGYLPKLRGRVLLEPSVTPLNEGSPSQLAAAQAACGAETRAPPGVPYDRLPLRWARELVQLQEAAKAAAPQVRSPALLLHGQRDTTAAPQGTLTMARLLGGVSRVRFFPQSPHVLSIGPERGLVAAEVTGFLDAHLRGVPVPTTAQTA